MKKKINIVLSLVLLLVTSVQAQGKLSLSDAITLGLQNNYDLQVMRSNEEVASINNAWGNTSLAPTIDFNATLRENFNFNDADNYREQTIVPEVSLNWVIFNGFSAKISKAMYVELEEQSQGNTAILVESSIQDIILAYNNCLLQKELVEVYEVLSALSEDRYNRAQDSKDLGVGTTYATLQAKTSWLEDQSNYLQQKVTYENAVRTLNFTLAVEGEPVWEFTSELMEDASDYNLEDLSSMLKSNNKTLKNQYLYQSLLAKETAKAKGTYLPTLSLNSGVNNSDYYTSYSSSTTNLDQNSTNAYVGLTLSWNIFNGGTRKRSVAIAQINEESSEVQTSQMQHSLDNQLAQIYSTYNVNKAILALSNEQVEAAKLNMEISADKLQNGSINSFNYRDVQVAYMNAAISQLQAQYSLIQSNTDLLRITGGIIGEFDN